MNRSLPFRRACVLASAAGALLFPQPGRCQDAVELRLAVCDACRIKLGQVGRVGSMDGWDALSEGARMAWLRGSVAVTDPQAHGEIRRFSLTGAYRGQFGGSGAGPGEQRGVDQMRVGTGDTLHVLDGSRGIVNRYHSSGTFVDVIRIPPAFDFLPLGGKRLAVASVVRSRSAAGYPLHIVDPTGIVMSFGGEAQLVPGQHIAALNRVLAPKKPRELWAAFQMDYRIEAWDQAGKRTALLTRAPPWFLHWQGVVWLSNTAPPASSIKGIYEDESGLLWVFLSVADENWRRMPSERTYTGERALPRRNYDLIFDTMIEVVDPRRGEVIAHARSGRHLTPIGDGYVYSYEEDAAGAPVYRIWRTRLVREPQ